jgi:hypothetical protein
VVYHEGKNYNYISFATLQWEGYIKVDLRVIEWGAMDWIHLAQDRDQWRALVNLVMKPWVP